MISSERAEGLKEILTKADKDIEDHDSEVARLYDKIRITEEQKLQMETQRAKLRSLLSPVRKLPNETLFHILQYVCEENIFQTYSHKSNQHPSTITDLPTMEISPVCSRWRELALSSPSLWANLTVKMSEGPVVSTHTVTQYLERSAHWPLRLTLSAHGPYTPSLAEVFVVMQGLTPHSCRWKTFNYELNRSLEGKMFPTPHLPLLAELDIRTMDPFNGLDSSCFEHSPRLRALAIRELPRSRIMCNQIDHLKCLGNWPLRDLAKALHNCPSLKSLELEDRIETYGVDLELGALGTWYSITELTFKGSLENVLSFFTFPSLNKLAVNYCHTWPPV